MRSMQSIGSISAMHTTGSIRDISKKMCVVDVIFGTLKSTPTMIWYQGCNRYDTNPQSDTQLKFRYKIYFINYQSFVCLSMSNLQRKDKIFI